MTKQPGLFGQLATTAVLHAITTIGCAMLFILLMNVQPFMGLPILFYRGLVALALSGVVICALLAMVASRLPSLPLRASDFLAAAIVAVALNLCLFTLGPVTVDRSISVFMLSRFDRADHPLTPREITDDFTRIYVGEWAQMERRLSEQVASGNLEKTADGYGLTAQGKAFMNTSRAMARLFSTDLRFVGLDGR